MVSAEPEVAYPRATWRLIVDGEADGPSNMAVDEAILGSVVSGHSPPTLRFYSWSPACLSLGRNQPLAEADLAACQAAGIDVLRRPSGGQAVLHADELTYSVVLAQTDPRGAGGVLEAYRRISDGLLAGLEALGVPAIQAVGQRGQDHAATPICFEHPSEYEVTVGERKLVGSAQWRSRGGVLQHGSLPLSGDLTRIVHYVTLEEEEREEKKRRLAGRVVTLEEAAGRLFSFQEAADALAAGLARILNLDLVPGALSVEERTSARSLRQSRYVAREWTAGR
ncbi:MAG: lipoate--protein ligase family protein [Anaerolineae bacterium]|nr:lipoate--protein ligase family protein [Anaerolineae bacterium]